MDIHQGLKWMGLGYRVTSLFNPQVFFEAPGMVGDGSSGNGPSGNGHLSGFKMGRSEVSGKIIAEATCSLAEAGIDEMDILKPKVNETGGNISECVVLCKSACMGSSPLPCYAANKYNIIY